MAPAAFKPSTRKPTPVIHRLIYAFRRLTVVPLVLNTPFNENEPVVCKPEEALDCFLRTKMDLLVIGSWMIERSVAAIRLRDTHLDPNEIRK